MFSQRILIAFALLGVAIFHTGCAGLTHKKNVDVISKIKKVAVIGFAVQEPSSAKIGLNLNSGKVHGAAGGSLINQSATETDQMYAALVKAFSKNMSWNVMTPEKMRKNPAYVSAYEKTMKGWQNKMPPGQGKRQFLVDNIMDNQSMRILGTEGRNKLIQGLGVDAIITAEVQVVLSGTSVMGFGARHPQSLLTFQLFVPNASTPDWFEGNIQGEVSEASVGATAFINEDLLNQLALKSAQTAFLKIGVEKEK